MEMEQFFNQMPEGSVEIDQKGVPRLVDALEVVGIILEEWTVLVSRNEGVPMEMPPFPMFRNADVARGCFRCSFAAAAFAFDGDAQCEWSVGGSDDAAVAIGLLGIVIATFFDDAASGIEFGVIMYGGEVARCEQINDFIHNWSGFKKV